MVKKLIKSNLIKLKFYLQITIFHELFMALSKCYTNYVSSVRSFLRKSSTFSPEFFYTGQLWTRSKRQLVNDPVISITSLVSIDFEARDYDSAQQLTLQNHCMPDWTSRARNKPITAELRRPHGRPSGAPYSYKKEKETHKLIFSWLSWLAVLLVDAYARKLRRRSCPRWRACSS